MTERLYLQDSMLFQCSAVVTECAQTQDGYAVELDRSVFFPNKGGQPCDTGTIGEAIVSSCDEKGDRLIHLCDRPLSVGETVSVSIDADRRFDIMQQHTGEHMLSWCAWQLYGAANVGFHCALDYATLDLDQALSHEQVLAIERMANRESAKNRAVYAIEFETEEELEKAHLPLRKHAEGLTAPIRIVIIEEGDACTCCAPHVKKTGEIGQMKIVGELPYKGGVRLTFLCGDRALKHAQQMQDIVEKIALDFSTSKENAVVAVEKQRTELNEARKELRQAYAALDEYVAKELKAQANTVRGTEVLVSTLQRVDAKRLRALAQKTVCDRSLTLLISEDDTNVYYVLSSNGIKNDMGEVCKVVNLSLGGRGGGRGTLAQGSAPKKPGLEETVQQLRRYCEQIV